MNVRMFWLACAAGLLSSFGANAASGGAAAPKLQMQVLSGPPQYVTGGNARVVVRASPDLHDKLEFWLNGQRIAPAMVSQGDRLEGVVEGLRLGANTLEVRHRNGRADRVKLFVNIDRLIDNDPAMGSWSVTRNRIHER